MTRCPTVCASKENRYGYRNIFSTSKSNRDRKYRWLARSKTAYRRAVESSVYFKRSWRAMGIGGASVSNTYILYYLPHQKRKIKFHNWLDLQPGGMRECGADAVTRTVPTK